MGLFDPWFLAQPGNGLLGGYASQYSPADVSALIAGYGPQWRTLPKGETPDVAIPASTPMPPIDPSVPSYHQPLMPTFSSVVPADDRPASPGAPNGSWVRPGSFLDKFLTNMRVGGQAQAAPAPAMEPRFSGAEPSEVWTGGGPAAIPAPQLANVPLPRSRPANLGIPPAGAPISLAAPQDNGTLPPGAQPTGGQVPPQAQPAAAAPQPDFLQRLRAASTNMANAPGFLPGVFDAIHGGRTGQAASPQMVDLGTDPFTGMKQYAQYDPIANQMRQMPIGGSPGAFGEGGGPSLGAFQQAVNRGVTGEALYQHLPATMRPLVKQYIDGRAPIPTQAALRNPATIAVMQAASAIDPTFDAANYPKRVEMIRDYAKGTPGSLGGQRNSGNTAVEHLGTLSKLASELDNVDFMGPDISALINKIRQHGSTDQAAKANALNNVIDRYVTEVGKYYAGSSTGGVAEREAARQRFSSVKTPKELAAAIQAERELFQGKLDQMRESAASTLGPNHPLVNEIIQPHAVEGFKKIEENLAKLRGGNVPTSSVAQGGVMKWTRDANGRPVPVQ